MMNKKDRMKQTLMSYGYCDACCNRVNKRTPVELPPNLKTSKIIIVVEAPNESGFLLSDSTRKFLKELVKSIGADWGDFVFVGAFRCPLVKNGLEKVEDSVLYCRGRLRRVLGAFRPRAIVLMGRIPLAFFKYKESVGAMRGGAIKLPVKTLQNEISEIPTIVTQHPNYYFKSGKNKKVAEMIADDLRMAIKKAGV